GPVALQSWASGTSPFAYGPPELAVRVREKLSASGYQVSKSGQTDVLSCCVTPRGLYVGINTAATSLADWAGGRVRLSRSEAQISRAEFKLEELFKLHPLQAAPGRALDLGASPGGWTKVLRSLGWSVHAVDPAPLDPRVLRDSGVRYAQQTAGEFLR